MTSTRTATSRRAVPLMLVLFIMLAVATTSFADGGTNASAAPRPTPIGGTETPLGTGAADQPGRQAEAPTDQPSQVAREVVGLSSGIPLIGAGVHAVNLDDTELEYVIFTFGDELRDVVRRRAFTLSGFAADSVVTAETVELIDDNNRQVLAGFAAGTALRQYTVASVRSGAVIDRAGDGNPPASIALAGSTVTDLEGRTGAPDLVDVDVDTTLERIRFTFDEQLDDGEVDFVPSAFGFVTASGRVVRGATAVTLDSAFAVVEFDDEVDDAAWFFVQRDAVRDRQGKGNTVAGIGQVLTVPQLASAVPAFGSTQYDFTFDQPITDVAVDRFVVTSDAGTTYEGDTHVRVDAQTIRVAFPEILDFSQEIVRASVLEGAVRSNEAAATPNVVGAVPLGSNGSRPGFTSGPDLLESQADSTGQVLFRFDEELAGTPADLDPSDFLVLTTEGDLAEARGIVEVDDEWLIVAFDPHLSATATGYVIEAEALTDKAGDGNALIAASR